MAGSTNAESKGFSLFSAINGLFERARMSAEKETQRLFTSPQPPPRKEHKFSSARPRRTRKPLSRDRKPPVFDHKGELFKRSSSVVSEGTQLASGVNLMAIQEDDALSVGTGVDAEPLDMRYGVLPGSPAHSKRKWSGHGEDTIEHHEDSPKRTRLDAANSLSEIPRHRQESPTPFNQIQQQQQQQPAETAASTEPLRRPEIMPPPPLAPQTKTLSQMMPPPRAPPAHSAASMSSTQLRTDMRRPLPPVLGQPMRRSQLRSNSVNYSSSIPQPPSTTVTASSIQNAQPRREPATPTGPAVVERARLEKVERELHRLKKIIASLLPEELNDDDLRSVYGDLDQPRLSSEDICLCW
ncbi:hypothetical protein GGI07_002805 [Coemansia sp. Benny D115]|nr:hypothetical protein GGI07_002805 [Coemansia sp. Benny D115]